jgi:hypothetical protein
VLTIPTIMRPTRAVLAALVLITALTAACQKPDVGARCALSWGSSSPAPNPQTAQGDYFETGNTECDDLICIVSPAEAGTRYGDCAGADGNSCGYCSKPCVSNADCFSSDTGLICDKVVLDEAFIATLPADVRTRYLGDVATSSYCVVPNR